MPGEIELRIGTFAVADGTLPVESLRGVLQEALARVAERLMRSPFARRPEVAHIALDALELGALSPDELMGPRAAERIADQLYVQLTTRIK